MLIRKDDVLSSEFNIKEFLSERNNFWYVNDYDLEILQHIQSSADRSMLSDELHAIQIKNNSWKNIYEFSKSRYVMFLPFLHFFYNKSILEIGSGTGAITRFLGENAKNVIAYEPSPIRFITSCYRNKELKNVDIVCGGIEDVEKLEEKEKYDCIVIVGVLEYSNKISYLGSDGNNEIRFLNICRNKLKNNGQIVIAIENRIGLRYFLPFREDHTSFFGESIHEFPSNTGIKTFTENELIYLLDKCGFPNQSFFYLHPDYKETSVIYTKRIDEIRNHYLAQCIFANASREYNQNKIQTNNEYYLIKSLIGEGVLTKFANSFLVFASSDSLELPNNNSFVLKRFNVNRQKKYNTEITVNDHLEVYKQYIFQNENSFISNSLIQNKETLYITLTKLLISRSSNFDIIINKLQKFYEYIQKFIENTNHIKFTNTDNIYELTISNVFDDNVNFEWFDKEGANFTINYENKENLIDLIFLRSLYILSGHPNLYNHFIDQKVEQFIKLTFTQIRSKNLTEVLLTNFIDTEAAYTCELFKYLNYNEVKNNLKEYIYKATITNFNNYL